MENLNTVFFYIIAVICAISALFCLFQKNTLNSIISAMFLLWGFSGFYFLLNAPYLAVAQILLWSSGIAVIILFSVMMTNFKTDEESRISFNLKTLFTPVLAIISALLIIPFILYQFKGYKTSQNFSMKDFALNLYFNNAFAFELAGILIFTVVTGVAAIIIIKNRHKNDSDIQKGENI